MIINIYGDPDTDNASAATMDRLITKIDDIKHRFAVSHIIAAGDFNFVLFIKTPILEQESHVLKQSSPQ